MASMQPDSQKSKALSRADHLRETEMDIHLMNIRQPSGADTEKALIAMDISSQVPPESTLIVREALRIDLPQHLVLRRVKRRLKTTGLNYTNLKDLVADLFEKDGFPLPLDKEVPMETNQLEEAMMMNNPVVKKALRMGAPTHLIKPLLRAKILSTGAPYTDVQKLLADLEKM